MLKIHFPLKKIRLVCAPHKLNGTDGIVIVCFSLCCSCAPPTSAWSWSCSDMTDNCIFAPRAAFPRLEDYHPLLQIGPRSLCVNHSRKEMDPLSRRRPSSPATVIPALQASVMLTLLELKRSHRTRAHLLGGETLISWWAEHPVGLPINTSRDTIQRGGRGGEAVIKLICRPPVKYKPQASGRGKWGRRVRSAAAILVWSS